MTRYRILGLLLCVLSVRICAARDGLESALTNPEYRNIRIENNKFLLRGATSVRARSTRRLRVTGNTIYSGREANDGLSMQTSDCADVLIERNVHLPLSQQ